MFGGEPNAFRSYEQALLNGCISHSGRGPNPHRWKMTNKMCTKCRQKFHEYSLNVSCTSVGLNLGDEI